MFPVDRTDNSCIDNGHQMVYDTSVTPMARSVFVSTEAPSVAQLYIGFASKPLHITGRPYGRSTVGVTTDGSRCVGRFAMSFQSTSVDSPTLRCTRCGEEKPLSGFYHNRASKTGYTSACKTCLNVASKAYYSEHRQARLLYAQEHNAERAANQKQYRARHADKLRVRQRLAYATSADKQAAHRLRNRKYQTEHPETERQRHANWVVAHHAEAIAINKRAAHKRRATERKALADLTNEQWQDILSAFDNRCAYCGATDIHLTQDHFIPVSKGGGYTASNIVPACKSCNCHKGTKMPNEWLSAEKYEALLAFCFPSDRESP